MQFHHPTLNQVRGFLGWFMGGELSSLSTSAEIKIKAINLNVSGNFGLVNQYKIQIFQLSRTIHFIFKNYVNIISYASFHTNNQQFIYTDEVNDQSISFGVILFNMALDLINPQLLIDHQAKEI